MTREKENVNDKISNKDQNQYSDSDSEDDDVPYHFKQLKYDYEMSPRRIKQLLY